MWQRRARPARKNSHGIGSIRRETYNSDRGFSTKSGWWEIRNKVFIRDQKRCRAVIGGRVCGAPGTEVHHLIPLSRGGTNSMSNLLTLCQGCHDKRHRHLMRSRG